MPESHIRSASETNSQAAAILSAQKSAQTRQAPPSAALRKDRLTRCITLLLTHKEELVEALVADFGARSPDMSLLTDIAVAIGSLKYARANLEKWMGPQPRRVTPVILSALGARAQVRYQPKGVIGIMTPWNFPIQLQMDALASAFAAGNRAMVKPSEYTPECSALMAQLCDLYFDQEELAFVLGDANVGAEFSRLPFDHLIFTGSTAVGRHVMRAASENLTPVTLELGGKCPVILGRSANIATAAARIMAGKGLNAGQICLAPDYVLAPAEHLEAFVAEAVAAASHLYPSVKDNPDFTAIINQRQFDRLQALLADARAKGAEIIEINPAKEDLSQQHHRRMPLTLILQPRDDMDVMHEEVFGPLLPIKTYSDFEDAIAYINARPRPLGLYYFGEDSTESEALLERTHSGGVSINDVIFHFSMEDLPFGGIGASGIGAYHGRRGFHEFSHEKAIYRQTRSELIAMLRPPYGEAYRKQVAARLKP